MSVRRTALSAAIILMASPGLAQENADPERIAAARQSVRALSEALKGQLVAAIKAGGPASAVSVCRTVAPELSQQISGAQGVIIKRTALRVRNPDNTPDEFELAVLKTFLSKLESGADPASLEHSEIVRENGAEYFRYMKAIPMAAEPCLACHGGDLKADVKETISSLYPQDQATGFKPGELRGAFSIIDRRPARKD